MCEADAFLVLKGREEKLLQNVDEVHILGEEIKLINLFGEQKVLKARLISYHSGQRKLLLEALP